MVTSTFTNVLLLRAGYSAISWLHRSLRKSLETFLFWNPWGFQRTSAYFQISLTTIVIKKNAELLSGHRVVKTKLISLQHCRLQGKFQPYLWSRVDLLEKALSCFLHSAKCFFIHLQYFSLMDSNPNPCCIRRLALLEKIQKYDPGTFIFLFSIPGHTTVPRLLTEK